MLGVFVASTTLLTAPRAPPSRHPPIRCALAEERANSGKAAVFSAVAGSVAALPAALVGGAVGGFTPQWELSHDVLALQLALFGVVYRYAAREDESELEIAELTRAQLHRRLDVAAQQEEAGGHLILLL